MSTVYNIKEDNEHIQTHKIKRSAKLCVRLPAKWSLTQA